MLAIVLPVLAGASTFGALAALVPTDAQASVSIAVAFDALVKDADTVGIVTPVESKSVWEEGRIYTYTRVKVDQGVAGELATGSEGWVRTMGGVVGKIGQLVDGEPVFTANKPSLVFMRKFKMRGPSESGVNGMSGQWEVSARAQGQYPVVVDESIKDTARARRVIRSNAVGVLLPPKTPSPAETITAGPPAPPGVTTKATDSKDATSEATPKARLAGEIIHDRPVDDVTREIAAAWKKAHTAAAPSDAKK